MSAENGRSRCFSILILSVVRPLPGEPRQAIANPLPGEPRQARVRRAFTRPQTKSALSLRPTCLGAIHLPGEAFVLLVPSQFHPAGQRVWAQVFRYPFGSPGHFGGVAGVALPFIVALTACFFSLATFVFFVFFLGGRASPSKPSGGQASLSRLSLSGRASPSG